MAIVVPADGVIRDVRGALPLISSEGLSRQAYSKFDTALLKTAWARHHQQRFALDGADVLASATQYDLAAVLEQRPVRVRGIGDIVPLLLVTHAHGVPSPAPSGCAVQSPFV